MIPSNIVLPLSASPSLNSICANLDIVLMSAQEGCQGDVLKDRKHFEAKRRKIILTLPLWQALETLLEDGARRFWLSLLHFEHSMESPHLRTLTELATHSGVDLLCGLRERESLMRWGILVERKRKREEKEKRKKERKKMIVGASYVGLVGTLVDLHQMQVHLLGVVVGHRALKHFHQTLLCSVCVFQIQEGNPEVHFLLFLPEGHGCIKRREKREKKRKKLIHAIEGKSNGSPHSQGHAPRFSWLCRSPSSQAGKPCT